MKKQKIFLACPVRGIDIKYQDAIERQVEDLECRGYQVYYPPRDTNQNDKTGLSICDQNRKSIRNADWVYVIWDGKSQGVLFDLGMAFALRKRLRIVTGYIPHKTQGKSFQNMMFAWENETSLERATEALKEGEDD